MICKTKMQTPGIDTSINLQQNTPLISHISYVFSGFFSHTYIHFLSHTLEHVFIYFQHKRVALSSRQELLFVREESDITNWLPMTVYEGGSVRPIIMKVPESELERLTIHVTVSLRNGFVVSSWDTTIPKDKALSKDGNVMKDKIRMTCPLTSKEDMFDNSHPCKCLTYSDRHSHTYIY